MVIPEIVYEFYSQEETDTFRIGERSNREKSAT